MNKESISHVKLGMFVAAGTVVLILALYMIGSNRNVFTNTIRISAVFYSVNGLMPGNNVRYAGIDVGTVDKMIFENDTTITVKMVIETKVAPFIKINAIASIGTDGLMGNKLVNINPVSEPAANIREGDVLHSLRPVETEEMVRTLNQTNNNLVVITEDLKNLTQKINKKNNLLNIFTDTAAAENIRIAISEFREAAENTNELSWRASEIVSEIKSGKGLAATLINDTLQATRIKSVIGNLEQITDSLSDASRQMNEFAKAMNDKSGLVYSLMKDSAMTEEVKTTLSNIRSSSVALDENMKALRRNFLFRKYFKEKEKQKKSTQ